MDANKIINGLNANTIQHLVFDAGAFFKNFDVKTDTFETAVTGGKLIGATKGGGSFKAVPGFRTIELDGMRGATKGTKILESWSVTMGAKIAEITPEVLTAALGAAADVETIGTGQKPTNYKKITGKNSIALKDYIDNITWIGTISGSSDPVIIQVFNALNEKGVELSFEDKGELTIETEFVGHYGMKTKEVPFVIYYPKLTEAI
jgi:hypothetical protein|nr:MAG TPA: major tail protein [Caudoviricetes sp.]